jgi:hypothetical protein
MTQFVLLSGREQRAEPLGIQDMKVRRTGTRYGFWGLRNSESCCYDSCARKCFWSRNHDCHLGTRTFIFLGFCPSCEILAACGRVRGRWRQTLISWLEITSTRFMCTKHRQGLVPTVRRGRYSYLRRTNLLEWPFLDFNWLMHQCQYEVSDFDVRELGVVVALPVRETNKRSMFIASIPL